MKKGTKIFIAGLVMTILGAFVLPYLMIMPLFKADNPSFQFTNPGKDNIDVLTPGKYYLWNDYQTFFDGQVYNTSKQLPNGTKITVIDSSSGEKLPFTPDASISMSTGNNAQNSIGYVEINSPQKVSIQIESSKERVYTFAQSRFMKFFSTIASTIILAGILTVSGVCLIIWGIIRMTTKEEEKQYHS